MTNPYFTAGTFTPHTTARAASIQGAFNDVETAFDTLHTALNDWGTASSTSTLTVGTGSKSLTIAGGHFVQTGQNVIISMVSNPANYMVGQVQTYDSGTGAATVNVTESGGSGSSSNWNVSITSIGESTRITGYTGAVSIAQLKTAMDIAAVTDAAVAAKAPIASPTFTGTPAAPTPAVGTDSTQIATTAFVQDEFDFRQAFILQAVDRTLTSTTSLQKLFDTVANGTLTLTTGSYAFECMFYLTTMSATSGNTGFSIIGAGSATLDKVLQQSVGKETASIGVGYAGSGAFSNTAAISSSVVEADVVQQVIARITGHFSVTGAGTIIPSLNLATAASAVVKAGSHFICRRLGASDSAGSWS